MSKARVVVLEVISGRLSVTDAANCYGLSRQHIYRLLKRYLEGGMDAVEPRSRRPASNPRAIGDDVIAAIVLLRLLPAGITGRLDRVRFQEGAEVKKGDVLFEIESTNQRLAVEQAIAKLTAARARQRLSQAKLERARKLLANPGI